jgi:hypothetical protein
MTIKNYLCLIIGLMPFLAETQTLGGKSAYSFAKMPASPQVMALGGINISNRSEDVSLAFTNPALLSASMHSNLALNFNSLYDGISQYGFMQAFTHPRLKTNFAVGINYLNYGNMTEADASGMITGSFRPRDYSIQLSASRKYLDKWTYGATIKYLHSSYGLYRSSAIAADVGLLYADTSSFLQIGLVAKNMGSILRNYQTGVEEELPFDLVLGISKKLEKAPVQFSLTAHHLHRFDILYDDTLFNNSIGAPNASAGKFTMEKLFQHLVFSTQIMIGKYLEVSAGYNFLRRRELRIYNVSSGLVGFSLGAGVIFPKLQIRYARSYLQNTTAFNQLGINLPLNKYIGFGKWGEKNGW